MNKILHSYLSPKKWEKEGELYQKIGTLYFLKITPFELRKLITGKNTHTIKSQASIPVYFRGTILAEYTHILSFIFVSAVCIYFLLAEGQWVAVLVFSVNILLNLYPVLLMRYNRFRIAKVLGKDLVTLLEGF